MQYEITWITLRLIPKTSVNREEIFKKIITTLGLQSVEHKFVNSGGNKHYFSIARYNGVSIKLPFYETMYNQGFIIEISEKGLKTLYGANLNLIVSLIETLLDIFLSDFEISFVRIDIETSYIPQKVLEGLKLERLKGYSTIYIGSVKSNIHCRYNEKMFTYVFRNKAAGPIICKLIENTYDGFCSELEYFLDNWKPHEITCCGYEISKELSPSSATK